jgi:hypothetical protein
MEQIQGPTMREIRYLDKLVDECAEARRDRARRRHLVEGSFADAKRHHFKRSRWRRLWRQQIQDWIIAAIQNIKLLIKKAPDGPPSAAQSEALQILALLCAALRLLRPSTSHPTRFHLFHSFA